MEDDKGMNKVRDISDLFEVFGKYQIVQYLFISLPVFFITMININYIFVAGDLNYRCRINECEDAKILSYNSSWWPNSKIDRCSRPVLRQDLEPGECTNSSFTDDLVECSEWVYESNNTVVAELNLACQPWKMNMIGTVHSIGMMVSMLISGWMADRFGRKPTSIICVVAGCIGEFKMFAGSYYLYILIEFLEAIVTGGFFTVAMLVIIEIAGKKYRVFSGVIFACYIYIGESIFACIAMFVPFWKNLIHIIYLPTLLFLSYIFIIYESPRWLIVSGRVTNAKVSLKRIAKINKVNIDYNELDTIDEAKLKEKFNIVTDEVKERFVDIFKSKEILKRLLVGAVCRFTSSFVYYGLMINSVWLPGDRYMNFFLSSLMSFPGEMMSLYLMNRIGRKVPLMVGYTISGVLCVLSAYIPESYLWTKIVAYLISKAVIAACFTGSVTYTMEMFPTSVRGSLLGLCSFSSSIGNTLAPLTPILNTISPVLPSFLFCCSAVLAGGLVILTPETKELPLMDTIRQVEDSMKKKRVETNTQSIVSSMETVVSVVD